MTYSDQALAAADALMKQYPAMPTEDDELRLMLAVAWLEGNMRGTAEQHDATQKALDEMVKAL